jgi:hypothetical protein
MPRIIHRPVVVTTAAVLALAVVLTHCGSDRTQQAPADNTQAVSVQQVAEDIATRVAARLDQEARNADITAADLDEDHLVDVAAAATRPGVIIGSPMPGHLEVRVIERAGDAVNATATRCITLSTTAAASVSTEGSCR